MYLKELYVGINKLNASSFLHLNLSCDGCAAPMSAGGMPKRRERGRDLQSIAQRMHITTEDISIQSKKSKANTSIERKYCSKPGIK